MSPRHALHLIFGLVVALTATAAKANPNFVFLRSMQDPANFESTFQGCISKFQAAGSLARSILSQLKDDEVVVYYQPGAAFTVNPSPGGDPTGRHIYLQWDSGQSGLYADKAPKVPCATLLHELQHAARFYTGKECTGPPDDNVAAYEYDEQMGSRAENWWLTHLHLKQRTTYPFGSKTLTLSRWTRWPASSSSPVPPAPDCNRCPTDEEIAAHPGTVPAACVRCTAFHQAGCIDFHGGIYSGGDHRRVANGTLRIIVGSRGYCQGRKSCQFTDCVTCPHLDTAFPVGVTVTAIATPGKDSKFARWGPGACKGKGETCTFTAKKPSCISAQFLLTNPTAPPQTLPNVPCREDP
jgi:hypothetical protein